MLQMSDGKYVVSCEEEGCTEHIILLTSDVAAELKKNKWSWFRGDEMYDHLCPKHSTKKYKNQVESELKKECRELGIDLDGDEDSETLRLYIKAFRQEKCQTIHEKDSSKLFNSIAADVYSRVFEKLLDMRKLHPSYRDDQLLMYMLCQIDVGKFSS